jgi:hypothetical protein
VPEPLLYREFEAERHQTTGAAMNNFIQSKVEEYRRCPDAFTRTSGKYPAFLAIPMIFFLAFAFPAAAAVRETAWIPDTCPESQFVFEWDDAPSAPAAQPVFTFKKVLKPCPAYAQLGGPEMFAKVMEENRVKNEVYTQVMTQYPSAVQTKTGPDGVARKVVKDFKFELDKTRKQVLTIPGLSASEKAAVQSWCDSRYGSGRVMIQ